MTSSSRSRELSRRRGSTDAPWLSRARTAAVVVATAQQEISHSSSRNQQRRCSILKMTTFNKTKGLPPLPPPPRPPFSRLLPPLTRLLLRSASGPPVFRRHRVPAAEQEAEEKADEAEGLEEEAEAEAEEEEGEEEEMAA